MGKVIDIDSRSGDERGGSSNRPRPSKTALVLGGGGFTGAVYEIGALRAFDLMAVNSTVNDFDIYVGTSAGSFVGSMVANGITADEMTAVLAEEPDTEFDGIGISALLRPNYRGLAEKSLALPFRLMAMARALAPRLNEFSLIDAGIALADAMPTGIHSGSGVREYVSEVLSREGCTDDFTQLRRELYLIATDLDTCERIVLGEGEWSDVPISKAVECSTALPVVYRPVELRGRHLIDGGIQSTTNIDVAVERGAELIVVINPLVPYVNDFEDEIPTMFGTRARRISDLGMPAVANQSFKLLAHARLHQVVNFWQEKYPGVDIVLIEPEPSDELMFGTSVLDFSRRREIAQHGFESVRRALASDYERYRDIAKRHGIEISGERLDQVAA